MQKADVTSQPTPPTLFLTDGDVRALADWRDAVETLRAAYAAPIEAAMVPARSMARAPGFWLRTMTAVSPAGTHAGAKLIVAALHSRRASYLIPLFERETAALSALIDGNQVTGLRTAATSALAADALAPHHPLRVAVLGAGFEARKHLQALASVRALASAQVFSPTPARRELFARDFHAELGIDVQAAASPRAAVHGADLVICAARSRDETPILRGEWLEPGMTVISIGSTLPEQIEVDVEVIRRADVIIADMPEEIAHDTGDMIAAAQAGIDFAPRLVALADLIGGRHGGRSRPDGIAVYKSVGSGLQDIVVAEALLRRARERGIGTPLPVSITPVQK
ncbi:MAG TPA: ornithine cyclodeaminase family protein [Steroidobacteraceae bacterium]|nr:ornithine cyclodeaminase family protein [Steroidobacteraceae bacterium]